MNDWSVICAHIFRRNGSAKLPPISGELKNKQDGKFSQISNGKHSNLSPSNVSHKISIFLITYKCFTIMLT